MLPQDYLEQKARQADLTPEQKSIFVMKFGTRKSNKDIAEQLNVTPNACIQCLGEIYKKFGIEGRGRGKEKRLRSELIQDFEALLPGSRLTTAIPSVDFPQSLEVTSLQSPSLNLGLPTLVESSLIPDAQYLKDWLALMRQAVDTLQNSEEQPEETDIVLNRFLQTLPRALTALALETQHSKAQVLSKIVESIDRLVVDLRPQVEKNQIYGLKFLQEDSNPLARSVFAFVARLQEQLGFDPQICEPWQIINQAIEEANQRYQDEKGEEPQRRHGMKRYSWRIRRFCFDIIRRQAEASPEQLQQQSEESSPQIKDLRLRRNLQAVDLAILDLYLAGKSREEANFNFFDIIRMRWLKTIPWGTFSEFLSDESKYQGVTIADQWEYERKALSALRKAYHQYDGVSLDEMEQDFGDRVKEREDTYCNKLFFRPNNNIKPFYKLVAVPQDPGQVDDEIDLSQYDAEISKLVWTYCQLAAKPRLIAVELDMLSNLLNKAKYLEGLDFWMREVDHFVAHALERKTDSMIALEASQQAQLKIHAINSPNASLARYW